MNFLHYFRKSYVQVPAYFVVFLLVALTFRGQGLNDQLLLLLSVASLLYGFYIAFAISRAKERQEKVLEQLRIGDGLFLSCSIQMGVYGAEEKAKFIQAVDKYLVKSIDYRLVDIDKSTKEFFEILELVNSLKPKTEDQKEARIIIIEALQELAKERTILEISAKARLSVVEWVILYSLFGVMLYFIFSLERSSIGGDVISAFLAAILAMLLTVLYKYNTLSWNEDTWIWQPLTRTFRMLGLLPYFPGEAVMKYRITLPKDKPYRIAHYNKPYPNVEDKEVEVVNP